MWKFAKKNFISIYSFVDFEILQDKISEWKEIASINELNEISKNIHAHIRKNIKTTTITITTTTIIIIIIIIIHILVRKI